MKKNFFKILIVLVCLVPIMAQAAVLAPKDAKVPEIRPLQPIPEFVVPNYEHSVSNPADSETVGSQEGAVDARPTTVEQNFSGEKQKNSNWIFVLTASLLGIIFVLTVFTLKKSRPGDNQ